ncbi:fumarylacetoacetate hydrolase family protein [Streptomyces sp. NBC_00154]|uniref:fumarylacetoacetate hydrolase family protein n=1 Tax=Streptomyces sp. NBC_00154 TaxID=2975670 RepID=UPI0022593CA0|nr:fumarylacetoacetate hydrolase family protein [Streptomyces sp. NBC_00154]MCX5317013.1 fumarylacetoacetate hydrolase family protein [Streptomyces sp. NBC_00154]
MKLLRVGPPGAERPVVLDGTRYLDISGVVSDIGEEFWRTDGVERVQAALAAGTLPEVDVTGLRIGPPIARPGVVLCIGMNYATHAAETGAEPPEHPVMFYKAPNTVVGPNDDVLLPRGSAKADWEVELAVVIGRRARYLESPADALSYIGGYCISNDVSERAFQLETSGGQWSKGKSCETFNPLGPWLVTADEIPDPQALGLRSSVNGEARQDSSTADMVFSVAHLIWQLSQVTVLEPGDVVNTGTPEGVAVSGRFPYLRPGDVMELQIEGLSTQRQRLQSAEQEA